MKLFFVYMHNNTDCRDDEVVKVLARTKPGAKRLAENHNRGNFTLGAVMTRKGLKRYDAEWHSLLWGTEPQFVEE